MQERGVDTLYMRSAKLPDSTCTYLEQHTAHIEVCVWVITGTLLNKGLYEMYSVSNPTTVLLQLSDGTEIYLSIW